MEITELTKLISDYGILIVIAGIFLWTYLKNEKNRNKRADANARQNKKERDSQNEMLKGLILSQKEQITQLVQMISTQNQKIETNFTHEQEELQSKIDDQIDNVLAELRDKTNAGRAMLIRYHNGQRDILGNSFLRMSCTNERVAIGISPFKNQFKNQFRSLIGHLCSEVKEKGYYYIQDIEQLKNENHITMYEFFKTRNINGAIASAVVSESNFIIGFILIEFLSLCPPMETAEAPLKNASRVISKLLTLNKGGE